MNEYGLGKKAEKTLGKIWGMCPHQKPETPGNVGVVEGEAPAKRLQ